jgi:hypothetical protein
LQAEAQNQWYESGTEASTLNKDMLMCDTMASVHKFPAVKTGRQGEFGAGS